MKLIINIPEECLKNISDAFEFGEDITKRTIDIILDSITKSTPIPDNATNGDVIEALFPNGKVIETGDGDLGYEIFIEDKYSFCSWFDGCWWNAPYQKGGKE